MKSLWKQYPQSSPLYAPVAFISLVGVVSFYSIKLHEYSNTNSLSLLVFAVLILIGGIIGIVASVKLGQGSVQVIHWLKLMYIAITKTKTTISQFIIAIIKTNMDEEYRILGIDYEDDEDYEQPTVYISFIGHNDFGVIKSQLDDINTSNIEELSFTTKDSENYGHNTCSICDQRANTLETPIYDSKTDSAAFVYNVCESCIDSIMTQAKKEVKEEYSTELTLKTI